MNPKAATAPVELAPDPVLATESLFVVGLTREGHVPLIVGAPPGEAHVVVRLPGLSGSRPLDPLPELHRRLRDEAGVDAEELVVMSRYGIPTGERGRATILLAPLARIFAPGPCLRTIPLAELALWLARCRSEGIRVDARVWVGLLLAERHFQRWAQARLRTVFEELQRRQPVPAVEDPS